MSLADLYRRVKENPSGHTYTVLKVEGWDNVYLGVNLAEQPCLLVRTTGGSIDPPLRTARVSLRPSQEFSLAIDCGASSRQSFHVLSCESSDRAEIGTFLVLIEAILVHHAGREIAVEDLATFFRSMVRLFAVAPARELDLERLGLWGELFMMRQIRGYRFWAPYWHGEVTRVFDFSTHGKRVEVKTTRGAQRIHHFSHGQIYAAGLEEIAVVSLLVREDDPGLSLRDLIVECRTALRNEPDYLKLELAVRHAGMEDSTLMGPRFDATEANRSMAWFRSCDVPHFCLPEPHGVSETRYKVDLSTAPRLAGEELEQWLASWSGDSAQASAPPA